MDSEKLQELNHRTALTSAVVSEISSTAYFVGYFFAFGLNWANKDTIWLECLLYSILSWINVGHILAGKLGNEFCPRLQLGCLMYLQY